MPISLQDCYSCCNEKGVPVECSGLCRVDVVDGFVVSQKSYRYEKILKICDPYIKQIMECAQNSKPIYMKCIRNAFKIIL